MGTIDLIENIKNSPEKKDEMIMTLEGATARIANAIELREMKQDRNFLASYNKGGLGRNYTTVQPLTISRKLGHPELIFDETEQKSMHFKVNAAAKWSRMQGDDCWICDQWKYVTIFFSRKNWKQHYARFEDAEKIA